MTFQELLKDERVIGQKEAEELRLCFFIFCRTFFILSPQFLSLLPPIIDF